MSREALVVGINSYTKLNQLKKPANDAEEIAQLLETRGGFRVTRLPCIQHNGQSRIDNSGPVDFSTLEKAIIALFNPQTEQTEHLPETALLYFAGHGLRKLSGGISYGFLATRDTDKDKHHWGLSLHWLQDLLQKSPIKQQIVWLDCCFSGELFNFKEADPGVRGLESGRCFIAASRDYEEAYESGYSEHGVLTEALLKGLAADGIVDNHALTDFIEQHLKQSVQKPVTRNSGSRIVLTHQPVEMTTPKRSGICPYKGLRFFEEADAPYFYGRDNLTDVLIEKVRVGHFLAVLGVSGSGKSSVVRAGLLHQLKQGQKLGESREWRICKPFTPTEKDQTPLENLARVLVPEELPDATWLKELDSVRYFLEKGAEGFKQWLDHIAAPRVVLVVDQFEELFTRCELTERQQFLECVLGCLPPPEAPTSKLCVVITMRADFLGKCAEQAYAGLTGYIDAHQVTVRPMSETELKAAISEPAKQVGLEIEAELITAMLKEVEGPASLPLLEYTLTELWAHRQLNCLTLAEYVRLGGVAGTLQKSADTAYEALSAAEQSVAQWIFLSLTQPGEGTEDTRKQVLKTELLTKQHSPSLIDQVLEKLTRARLVVVDSLGSRGDKQSLVMVIDVAHEALIRHWGQLQRWLSDNRRALIQKSEIDSAAKEWEEHGKYKDYLWQGPKLAMAEDYLNNYADKMSLSELADDFVQASQEEYARVTKEKEGIQRKLEIAQQLFATNKELEETNKALQAANKKGFKQSIALKLLLIIIIVFGLIDFWQQGIEKQRSEITELRYKGLLLERTEEHHQALNYYQKALKISQAINDYKAQVSNLSDCGTMYMNLNKPNQALNYFKQALKIREQLGDSEGIYFETNNIVLAYTKLGEIEKALNFYEQVIGVEEKGSGQFVGFIDRLNCSNDAFELLSNGSIKSHLYAGRPLYYADQLKVIKKDCEIWVIEDNDRILVNKANSPYIVENNFPSGKNNFISKFFSYLWKEQNYKRAKIPQ